MSGSKREDSVDGKSRRLRKPPNAFLLFSNSRRHALALANPSLSASKLSQLLGQEWNDLPEEEKEHYFETAKLKRQEFMRENPGYSFSTPKRTPEASKPGKRSWSLGSRWPLLHNAQGRAFNVPTSVPTPLRPQLQPESYRCRMSPETFSFEPREDLTSALTGLSPAQSEAFQRMMGVAAPTAHRDSARPLEPLSGSRPISLKSEPSSSLPFFDPSVELSRPKESTRSPARQSSRSPVMSHSSRSPYMDVLKLRPDTAPAPLRWPKSSSAPLDSDLSSPLEPLVLLSSQKRRRVGLSDSPPLEDSVVQPFGPSGASQSASRFFPPSPPHSHDHVTRVRDVAVVQRRDISSTQARGGHSFPPPSTRGTASPTSFAATDSRADLLLAPFPAGNSTSGRRFPSDLSAPAFDERNELLEPLPSISALLQTVSSSRSGNPLPPLRPPTPAGACPDSDSERELERRISVASSVSSQEMRRERGDAFRLLGEHKRDAMPEQYPHQQRDQSIPIDAPHPANGSTGLGKRLRYVVDSSSDAERASRTPPDVNFDWLSLPPLSVPRLPPCSFPITSA